MNEYVDFNIWKTKILKSDDSYYHNDLDNFYKYYTIKNTIVKKYKPSTIAEIGVRYGYSAHAFLYNNNIKRYIGVDYPGAGHGGVSEDTFPYVDTLLTYFFPDTEIILIERDSQTIDRLPNNYKVDFFHIDGNHYYNGCLHDLYLAMNSLNENGIILVDDYIFINEVKQACNDFVEKEKDFVKNIEIIDSYRGEFIIKLIKSKNGTNTNG